MMCGPHTPSPTLRVSRSHQPPCAEQSAATGCVFVNELKTREITYYVPKGNSHPRPPDRRHTNSSLPSCRCPVVERYAPLGFQKSLLYALPSEPPLARQGDPCALPRALRPSRFASSGAPPTSAAASTASTARGASWPCSSATLCTSGSPMGPCPGCSPRTSSPAESCHGSSAAGSCHRCSPEGSCHGCSPAGSCDACPSYAR